METFLYIVFFLSCIILVITVLLQPGKTDAGALFTSGVSSASMNPRGTASVLSKLTIVMATIFMLSALMLSLPALTGNRSVLETQGPSNAPTAPVPTTNANTANAGAGVITSPPSNTSDNNSAANIKANSNMNK